MSIEELKEKLRFDNECILTSNEIQKRGISRYYLTKLAQQDILIKQERGKYLVSLGDKKTKNILNAQIKSFKYNVRHYQFGKAYNNLVKFYEAKPKAFSYEYIYICFSLLEQILGDLYDFEILKELRNNQELQLSDLSYQSSLKMDIINGNYEKAIQDIYKIKKDGHSLDIDVLLILIKETMRKNKTIDNSPSIDTVKEAENYFTKFEQALKAENYVEAKANLQNYCNLNISKKNPYDKELLILVNGLIDLQENKISFDEDKEITYEGSHEEILLQAIRNKDFKVAFSKIGACTYKTTNTSYLLMKDILYKMHAYKSKDEKIESKEAIKEDSIKESLISTLYPYIMVGDFNKAQEIIANSKEESRLKDLCIALFEELNIVKNRYKSYNQITLQSQDLYSQAFEAIRRRDLYQVRELLEKANTSVNNKKEFQIYTTLIDKILFQNQLMRDKKDNDRKLTPFFNNSMYLSLENIINVKTILEERIKLYGENKRDYHLLNIIDVIFSSNETPITKDDFSSISSEKEKPLDKLNEYLDNGEYILALELIDKTSDWKVFASDYSIFDIKTIKYLLKTLEKNLYQYIPSSANISEELKETPTIYSLIKHRKYKEAFQFYLEHKDTLYETEEKDLIKNLIVLYYFQLDEGIKLYEEYLKAKEEGNRNLERIALLNYKEYLKINNIDENYVPVLKK